MSFAHSALRVFAFIAGGSLLYASLLLYEDEQGHIQNKLEEWWVRSRDAQSVALSRHAAFLRQIARLCTDILDRLFGTKLISVRAFSVSVCYSIASVCATSVAMFWAGSGSLFRIGWILASIAFILLGTAPALARTPSFAKRGVVAQGLVVISLMLWMTFLSLRLPLAFAASILFSILFVALTRRLLMWCVAIDQPLRIMAVIIGNILLALLLELLPVPLLLALFFVGKSLLGFEVPLTLGVNVFLVVTSLLFVVLSVGTLAHRLFWPAVSRPLYAIAAMGVVRRRTSFGIIGFALLTYGGLAIPPWVTKLAALM